LTRTWRLAPKLRPTRPSRPWSLRPGLPRTRRQSTRLWPRSGIPHPADSRQAGIVLVIVVEAFLIVVIVVKIVVVEVIVFEIVVVEIILILIVVVITPIRWDVVVIFRKLRIVIAHNQIPIPLPSFLSCLM
jgi:hypothetical protein